MIGNPAAERAAIETTYEDTADVMRTAPVKGPGHITKAVPSVVYSAIICALSYSGGDKSEQTKVQNDVDYDAEIFAPPELKIRPGDRITLKRFGRGNPASGITLEFEVVGRPLLYATHQQIRVKDGDLA